MSKSSNKAFAILAGIFALLIPVFQIIWILLYGSFANIFDISDIYGIFNTLFRLSFIAMAVLFFIRKSRIGISVTIGIYTLIEVLYLLYESLDNIFSLYLLVWVALLIISILSIFNIKAVKYIFYIPAVVYLVCLSPELIDILPEIFKYPKAIIFQIFYVLLYTAFFLFAGLFFASCIEPQKAPYGNMPCAYPDTFPPAYPTPNTAPGTTAYPAGKQFCLKCGTENKAEDAFCVFCGSKLPQ